MAAQSYAPGGDRSLEIQREWRGRSGLERFLEAVGRRPQAALILAIAAVAQIVFPLLCPLALLLSAFVLLRALSEREALPIKMPFSARRKDPNDGFRAARGTFYLGTVRPGEPGAGQQIWVSPEEMLEHFLVLGTTGSGKSQFLIALAANALAMGTGFIFSDAKAESSLPLFLYGMAAIVGAEDDFLVIDYRTGSRRLGENDRKRYSNTCNPFAIGSADALTQVLVGMLSGDDKGENAVFRDRAVSLMSVLMMALVELRDKGRLQLGVRVVRDFLTLPRIAGLAGYLRELNRESPQFGQRRRFAEPVGHEEEIADRYWDHLSEFTREALLGYMHSLPGYDPTKAPSRQGQEPTRQHGFAQFYWTRALSDLVETYRHIYGTEIGEIDYQDVVLNRRILVIALPALEKSTDALGMLGKIGLAAIRTAMSVGLGAGIEGTRREVLEARPSAANHPVLGIPVPMLNIFDEYGYQAANGFAVTAAQARGLGFSCVFAGQDLPGFKTANEREAWQIVANTKMKLFGALEDPKETWELARLLADETLAERVGSYKAEGSDGGSRPEATVTLERTARVNFLDLKKQGKGHWHLMWLDRILRMEGFYVNPKAPDHMVINRYVGIPVPVPDEVARLSNLARSAGRQRDGRRQVTEPPPHRNEWEAVGREYSRLGFPPDLAEAYAALARALGRGEADGQEKAALPLKPVMPPPPAAAPEFPGPAEEPEEEPDDGMPPVEPQPLPQPEQASQRGGAGQGESPRTPDPETAGVEARRQKFARLETFAPESGAPPEAEPGPPPDSGRDEAKAGEEFEAMRRVTRRTFRALGEEEPEELAEIERRIEQKARERLSAAAWPDAAAPRRRTPENEKALKDLIDVLKQAEEEAGAVI